MNYVDFQTDTIFQMKASKGISMDRKAGFSRIWWRILRRVEELGLYSGSIYIKEIFKKQDFSGLFCKKTLVVKRSLLKGIDKEVEI